MRESYEAALEIEEDEMSAETKESLARFESLRKELQSSKFKRELIEEGLLAEPDYSEASETQINLESRRTTGEEN